MTKIELAMRLSFDVIKALLFLIAMILGVGIIFFLFAALGAQVEQEQKIDQFSTVSELGKKEIPPDLLPIYQQAASKYGIPWEYLAAIHWIETRYGRTTAPGDAKRKQMVSSVGAQGPMQFMDLTWIGWGWAKDHPGVATKSGDIPNNYPVDITDCKLIARYNGYGKDGNGDGICDPWNEVDAIHAAADYLARNGAAKGQISQAIRMYNHSEQYVQSVLNKASEISIPVASGSNQNLSFSGRFAWPIDPKYSITSRFGMRKHPIKRILRPHKGIDIGAPKGVPVFATESGVVSVRYDLLGYGNYVVVDHGKGYSSLYAHLSSVSVRTGQVVKKGQEIGKVGSTGSSTAPHLHFEIRINNVAKDPLNFFKR